MPGETQLKNAVHNLRQTVNELRTANDEVRRALDMRRAEIDHQIDSLNQQINQTDHQAAESQRSDQERATLQDRSHVFRTEIDNLHKQYSQIEANVRQQITAREQVMHYVEQLANNLEHNISPVL